MNKKPMQRLLILAIVTLFLLAGCGKASETANLQTSPEPTLEEIIPTIIAAPNVDEAVSRYLTYWTEKDYASMYDMLSPLSKDSISFDDFSARYQYLHNEANIYNISYQILSTLTNPRTAMAAYSIHLESAIFSPIDRDTTMDLVIDNGEWKVVWAENLILPEFAGGNTLSAEYYVPERGNLYDRNGTAIAYNTNAVAVSAIPSLLEPEFVGSFAAQLAQLSDSINMNVLIDQLTAEDPDYLIPVVVVPSDVWAEREEYLLPYGALSYTEYYGTRYYLDGGPGAQTLGYVGSIPTESIDYWAELGYSIDDRVGRQGLEFSQEDSLAGTRGGALYVVSPYGDIVTKLSEKESAAANSVYSTIDIDLQRVAQQALGDFTGAVVVLERDTGRVLAMVSSPNFDPNDADINNPNSQWNAYFGQTDDPFFNRATQGQYPPGSIFKVITASAALESGQFTPESSLYCDSQWYGLGQDAPLDDWTLAKELPASGDLVLYEGIMRSCNPWFYQIGMTLYNYVPAEGEDNTKSLVAELARGFGLGSPTGIQEVPEESGSIVNPDDTNYPLSEAVQQGIGQGVTLITPIQAAVYTAAIGNGGTLYRPQLIEKIENPNGDVIQSFEPVVNGTLPISDATLSEIQKGMYAVVNNARGTAYRQLISFTVPVYGKTGTAQNPGGDPHAWFIGYTAAEREDVPDLAIAVLIENIGDGSEFAAPIFKRVAEAYFYGSPSTIFPWESQFGVTDPEYFIDEVEGENTTEENNTVPINPN